MVTFIKGSVFDYNITLGMVCKYDIIKSIVLFHRLPLYLYRELAYDRKLVSS